MLLLERSGGKKEVAREEQDDKVPWELKGGSVDKAEWYREYWQGIKNEKLLANISYQMQYLEFLIKQYNTYQLYLTLESLHLKTIQATIAGILEAALYDLVAQTCEKAAYPMDERRSFLDLIDDAYDMELIDQDLRDELHQTRKDRNKVHFRSLPYLEYSAYEFDEVNKAIVTLNDFIKQTQPPNEKVLPFSF